MNYEKIGEFIASKRKEKDLTQNELAKKVGVTDKAVSKWERGLGCPDVSILEVLAKELGVSVLELLKGRKIENEVINVTEADDYIKETFKVSKDVTKNNILNYFSKIIFYLILFISIIFICLSCYNYYKSSTGEIITIDDSVIENNSVELERLKSNIELLKNNRGILTEKEQEDMISYLEKLEKYSENYFVLKLDKNKKYSTNDIMVYYLEDIASTDFPAGIVIGYMNIFKNHNMYDDYKPRAILSNMYKEQLSSSSFINYYKKENQQYFNFKSTNSLIPIISYDYYPEDTLSYACDMMLATVTDRLKVYNLLTEDLLKAGGINE